MYTPTTFSRISCLKYPIKYHEFKNHTRLKTIQFRIVTNLLYLDPYIFNIRQLYKSLFKKAKILRELKVG